MNTWMGKLKVHVEDIAFRKTLTFTFYRLLHILGRRVPLPEATFEKEKLMDRWNAERRLKEYMTPRRSKVCVDVGANIGLWTLHLAKQGFKVHAFEPDPRTYRILKKNVEKYDVSVYPCAVGEHNYEAKLNIHYHPGHNSIIQKNVDYSGRKITVQVRTLDSFTLDNVGLIKIDTEGYEIPVLEGARETIRKFHPRLIIEVHKPYKEQTLKIESILEELYYHWIMRHKLNRDVKSDQFHILADPNIDSPFVSLIISNLNGKRMLRECLNSLEKLNYPNYEVIVVDAGSTDGSADMVAAEFPNVKLIRERTIGIYEAINKGLLQARGTIIGFNLNSDEVFSENWLRVLVNELISSFEKKIVGGVRVFYGTSGIVDAAGGMIGYSGRGVRGRCSSGVRGRGENVKSLPQKPREVTYLGAPVFFTKLLRKIGLCDEKYYIRTGDWDFCEKARKAGYKIVSVPSAVSYHRRSATVKPQSPRNLYYSRRNDVRLFIKHYPVTRMMVALVTWAAIMLWDMFRLFPPVRKVLIYVRLARSEVASEYYRALVNALWWNLRNIGDHFKARKLLLCQISSTMKGQKDH